MIWLLTTILLYLLISAASLFLICSGEETNDQYYDIRNIVTAMVWPLVLVGSGLVWVVKKIGDKPKIEQDAK